MLKIDANNVIQRMNDEMQAKDSDVRFFWGPTSGSLPDPKGYFLLWGYLKSKFSYENKEPMMSVFIFKGMATMLEGVLNKSDTEIDEFEKYVTDSLTTKV